MAPKSLCNLPAEMLVEIFKNVPAGDLLSNVRKISPYFSSLSKIACEGVKRIHIMTHNSALQLHSFENPHFFDLNRDSPVVVLADAEKCVDSRRCHPIHLNLYTSDHVQAFVAAFPAIEELTISGSYIDACPATIYELIDSYPGLKRLECSGKFELVESLAKLEFLEHFAHIHYHDVSHTNHRPKYDAIYMSQVPQVMARLASLKLDSWSDSSALPGQLKEVRFRHYPDDLHRLPQLFPVVRAVEESIYPPATYDNILRNLEYFSNLESVHLVFGHLDSTAAMLKSLYNSLQIMPTVRNVVLEYPLEYFRKENDGPAPNGVCNSPVLTERIRDYLEVHARAAPIEQVKNLRFIGIELPVSLKVIQKLFPNAEIGYCRRFQE